ncbi:UNVERIFIED_CONTAM: hypothetical protein Sradi_1383600 [Sesamum radiatum]|uniref:Uncharacterized protein n=1 Tax=Sesamum radiatum TaxID=300843 RepID=A0AAW2UUI6_SESRA
MVDRRREELTARGQTEQSTAVQAAWANAAERLEQMRWTAMRGAARRRLGVAAG